MHGSETNLSVKVTLIAVTEKLRTNLFSHFKINLILKCYINILSYPPPHQVRGRELACKMAALSSGEKI